MSFLSFSCFRNIYVILQPILVYSLLFIKENLTGARTSDGIIFALFRFNFTTGAYSLFLPKGNILHVFIILMQRKFSLS